MCTFRGVHNSSILRRHGHSAFPVCGCFPRLVQLFGPPVTSGKPFNGSSEGRVQGRATWTMSPRFRPPPATSRQIDWMLHRETATCAGLPFLTSIVCKAAGHIGVASLQRSVMLVISPGTASCLLPRIPLDPASVPEHPIPTPVPSRVDAPCRP